MFLRRWSVVSTVAGIGGGLILTLLSGLYVVKPFVTDADIIHFGFPLPWFTASRGGLLVIGPWKYDFNWLGFTADFIVYGSMTAGLFYLLLMAFAPMKKVRKSSLFHLF